MKTPKRREIRSQMLTIRLTEIEYRSLRDKLEEADLINLSEFVRPVLLGRPVPRPRIPSANLDANGELVGIENNLRQLSSLIDQGRGPGELRGDLHVLFPLIKKVRYLLLGFTPNGDLRR